jgi:small subunit ribosomal protein S17
MKKQKKTKTAVVVSDKMDKTVVVTTHRLTKHKLYGKYIKKRIKFKAHDEQNQCHIGDTVVVQETRPLSKDKRWMVVDVVARAL